jgi:hypothetical protein
VTPLKPHPGFWIALVCVAGAWWLRPRPASSVSAEKFECPPAPAPAAGAPSPTPSFTIPTKDATPPAQTPVLFQEIEALLLQLQKGQATAAELSALKQKLLRANPKLAIQAILQFLATGRDAVTGAEFSLGAGGLLQNAPTLRVTLMDWLGKIARDTRLPDAALFGRSVLSSATTPEEWAVSLRNVAWHDPQSGAFLSAKFREMILHSEWRKNPSAGFLEAMDVAVFVKDPQLVGPLAALLGEPQPSVQRAAAVALDRLSEAAPLAVMTYLNTHPETGAARPLVRADYFAKADLSQPLQREALETYLDRADVSAREKEKCLQGLATPASFVSDNLLTTSQPTPENPSRQIAFEQTLQGWVQSNRFPALRPALEKIRTTEP